MEESKSVVSSKSCSSPASLSPPSLRPASRKPTMVQSFTRDEINRYWRMRRMIEEDHLLFAEKAAARIRAKSLKEEDHRRFEELIREMLEENEAAEKTGGGGGGNKELRVGIKDWWTKSKYAYLNQPALKSMGENTTPKGDDLFIPQKTCFYLSPAAATLHFCAKSFGVY